MGPEKSAAGNRIRSAGYYAVSLLIAFMSLQTVSSRRIINKREVGEEIMDAARQGNMAKLQPLVEEWSGTDVLDWTDPDMLGATPLIICAMSAHFEAAKLLLDHGADINLPDMLGNTPLQWISLVKNHADIATKLQRPAILQLIPLMSVFHREKYSAPNVLATVRLLLVRGDVNKANKNGTRALIASAANGNVEIVRLLLNDQKIDVNIADTGGHTALMYTVFSQNRVDALRLLLAQRGLEVNKANTFGMTALIYAILANNVEAVKLLLAHGADVNRDDGNFAALTALFNEVFQEHSQASDGNRSHTD